MPLKLVGIAVMIAAVSLIPVEAVEPPSTAAEPAARAEENLRWVAPDGGLLPFADDQAALEFLETAAVLERETIDKGITRPARLLLEKDGTQAHAVFHTVDVSEPRRRMDSGVTINYFRDSFRRNVAAYKFSRILGVNSVPPVVLRKIGRDEGSVQLWIEDTYDETERREMADPEAMPVDVRRRISDMWVFDNLINNIDRNEGNMLHSSAGEFWWIDHTRTFLRGDELPHPDRIRRCSRGLMQAMRELDRARVDEVLSPYLDKYEIDALFERRQKVVQLIEELIESKGRGGENVVLFTYD